MSLTQTLIAGPTATGPGFKQAIYHVAWDSSYPTGGEPLDCTDEFTYVYGVVFAGNDTSADNTFVFNALIPAPTTACTTSNVLIQAWLGGTTDAVLEEEGNTTNLSAIGQMAVIVYGV
jgi:hypothetical protein